MSVDAHRENSSPEISLIDVMDAFEKRRKTYFDMCWAYSYGPTRKNLALVEGSGEEVIDAIIEVMYFILEDGSMRISEQAVMLAAVVKTDDDCRREYFERLTNKPNDIDPLIDQESLAKTYEEFFADDGCNMRKFLDDIEDDYRFNLTCDMDRLREEFGSSSSAPSIRAAIAMGERVLDAVLSSRVRIELRIGR